MTNNESQGLYSKQTVNELVNNHETISNQQLLNSKQIVNKRETNSKPSSKQQKETISKHTVINWVTNG